MYGFGPKSKWRHRANTKPKLITAKPTPAEEDLRSKRTRPGQKLQLRNCSLPLAHYFLHGKDGAAQEEETTCYTQDPSHNEDVEQNRKPNEQNCLTSKPNKQMNCHTNKPSPNQRERNMHHCSARKRNHPRPPNTNPSEELMDKQLLSSSFENLDLNGILHETIEGTSHMLGDPEETQAHLSLQK